MRLSVAMIVKDEAARLPACLASLQGVADEVVVVDTGSTDGTPALAEGHGAGVIHRPWTGDFSEARNASLAACTGDWILVLDADEQLDPAEHGRLREALTTATAHAYRLTVRTYLTSGAYLGHGGTSTTNDTAFAPGRAYPYADLSRHLRLFRAQREPVYRGRVHELPDGHFEARGLAVEDLAVTLHHFGKVDIRRDLAKQAAYLDLALQELAARPQDPEAHWNVLQEALVVKDWGAALEAAETVLRLQGGGSTFVRLGAARAHLELGGADGALQHLEAVLAVQPDSAPALTLKAEALAALGQVQEAQGAFGEAMSAQPHYTQSYLKASEWLARWGDRELARQVLEAGLDQNPEDQLLWETLVATSTPEEAPRAAWEALQALPRGGEGIWHQLVALGLLARGERGAAAEVLDQGLAVFPGHLGLVTMRGRH